MEITLRERTEESVRTYFEKAGTEEIRRVLPQKAKTVEEAVEDYRKTLLPDAASFGETVFADGVYVGDVWCYCIDLNDEPNCMLSYCIFEKDYWGKGIATEAVRLFLEKIRGKYGVETVGAFTYARNLPSLRILEKNGFTLMEEFEEDGAWSKYLQLTY